MNMTLASNRPTSLVVSIPTSLPAFLSLTLHSTKEGMRERQGSIEVLPSQVDHLQAYAPHGPTVASGLPEGRTSRREPSESGSPGPAC